MNTEVKILFPDNRLQEGSIVNVYSCLPSKNEDFQRFVILLSESTHSKQKTVIKWLKARRVPTYSANSVIELTKVLKLAPFDLFTLINRSGIIFELIDDQAVYKGSTIQPLIDSILCITPDISRSTETN